MDLLAEQEVLEQEDLEEEEQEDKEIQDQDLEQQEQLTQVVVEVVEEVQLVVMADRELFF